MSNISDVLCKSAADLASSTLLKSVYVFKTVAGIIGAVCVIYVFRIKGSTWIPNPTAKILYCSHLYFAFHMTIFYPVIFVYHLIRTSPKRSDPCFYVIDARFSCAVRELAVLGVIAQSFNMLTFAVERAISTLYLSKADKTTKPYFGIFLVLLAILLACSIEFFCDYQPIGENSFVSGLTIRNPQNVTSYQIACYINLILEIVTISIFGFTYHLNMWKNNQIEKKPAKTVKLGHRYQIAENIKVIRTLLPCFLVHFFLNAVSYLALSIYPFLYPNFEPVSSTVWVEYFSLAQFYTIIMPWIVLWQIRRSHKVAVYDAAEATRAHFQRLHEIFNR